MNDPNPSRLPDPERPERTPAERPAHPQLAAALLMVGVVAFLVLVSLLAVR